MLRATCVDLGRWSSRDFLRSRSKRAGAVHTRHTHGRQGRYKRLSSITSSIRDGRRHAGNHMQGGLGLKLGGGLFGLRIPRQHQLSHISREQFDLEVYGHPNITNPYREHLDEHPDLKSVMMNAAVALRLVVLLPSVPRRATLGEGGEVRVPERWLAVVRELRDTLSGVAAAALSTQVHLTTLEASVCCRSPAAGDDAPGLHLDVGAAHLYHLHCSLGARLRPEAAAAAAPRSTAPSQRRRPPAVFMGAALRAPVVTSASPTAAPPAFTSAFLASLTKGAATATTHATSAPAAAGTGVGAACERGIAAVVRELSATGYPTLRLCLRPTMPVSGELAAAPARRRVLKAQIDPNSSVGVWQLTPSPLSELLRWHYCAQDPRAHNQDAVPHHQRHLPILLVVDSSSSAAADGAGEGPATTLMPRRLSLELESAGFKMLAEPTLLDAVHSLGSWLPSRQWDAYTHARACAPSAA